MRDLAGWSRSRVYPFGDSLSSFGYRRRIAGGDVSYGVQGLETRNQGAVGGR